jgi:putative ABC transport system ATP-binding protein
MTDTPLYDVRNVSKLFSKGPMNVRAVDDVTLTIAAGEFVALEGPSGSGKTTLLQLLGALDRPSDGHVFFEGRDLGELKDNELADLRLRAFGFVFQHYNLIPTLTAVQNVELALAPMGVKGTELRDRSLALLAEVGLAPRASHLPSQLSGGEQQRVSIARALVVGPRVILADEPTGNLDTKTGADIIELLVGLAAEHGTTIVVATHDAGLAARAPRRLAMRDGSLVPGVNGAPAPAEAAVDGESALLPSS